MTQHQCILLLGTDLGDKKYNLKLAKVLINKKIGAILMESKIMETEPIGFSSKTTFLNQVIKVSCPLSPHALLQTIKSIEREMGRVYKKPKRHEQYTSRIIDIDIILFDSVKMLSPALLIPHPQLYTRFFVSELLIDMQS